MTASYSTTGKLNGLALAGFIVSLVGLVLFFTSWVGALIGLVGLILSVVGRRQVAARGDRGRGLALAGIIIGIAAVVIGILVLVVVIAVIGPQLATVPQS